MQQEIYISSRKNETLRETAKLLSSVDARRNRGEFLAEGARLCRDAVRSGVTIRELYYTDSAFSRYPEYISEIREKAEKVYRLADHAGEVLSGTKTSQGVFCVCEIPSTDERKISFGHCLALENIQDPGNLGTIMRTAEALGIHCVLLCGDCCDVYSPKSLRAGMGSTFRLPVVFFDTLQEAVAAFRSRGYASFAAVPDSTALPVTTVDFSVPALIAVGNEGNGLTNEAIASCDARVTIPMLGRAESLNAAASASILMWEMMREGEPHEIG